MPKKEILNNDLVTLRVPAAPVETVESLAQEVADMTEALADRLETGVTVVRNNPLVLAGVAVAGLAVGGYVAYRITKKRMTLKYEQLIEDEVEAAKNLYTTLGKRDFETPEAAVEELVPDAVGASEALSEYQGKSSRVAYNTVTKSPESEVVVERTNIFTESSTTVTWDMDQEISKRTANPHLPYVISHEEFLENEPGYEQGNLAYFRGDDILADEKDSPVDIEDLIDSDNLQRFGHGSNDKKVVYIRNDRMEMDWEVILSEDKFEDVVLGGSLRHSARGRRGSGLRFRQGDDE